MQAPSILFKLFPSITWKMPAHEKKIYLTFDDGPIPIVTPWVLDTLDIYNAKATFFCIGANVLKYPEIYSDILARGHKTGNHTHNHLNGWTTTNKKYFLDIDECEKHVRSKLFRPPYGKIKLSQLRHLRKKYKLIMWDVLSQDYDVKRSAEQCLQSVIKGAKEGSIVVFHDSIKAENRLRYSLKETLEHFSSKGFEFVSL